MKAAKPFLIFCVISLYRPGPCPSLLLSLPMGDMASGYSFSIPLRPLHPSIHRAMPLLPSASFAQILCPLTPPFFPSLSLPFYPSPPLSLPENINSPQITNQDLLVRKGRGGGRGRSAVVRGPAESKEGNGSVSNEEAGGCPSINPASSSDLLCLQLEHHDMHFPPFIYSVTYIFNPSIGSLKQAFGRENRARRRMFEKFAFLLLLPSLSSYRPVLVPFLIRAVKFETDRWAVLSDHSYGDLSILSHPCQQACAGPQVLDVW